MSENGLEKISPKVVQVVRDEVGEPAAEPAPINPLLKLQALLHGRYMIAAILAVIFAAGGSFAAWQLTPPKYEIVGYVHVKSYVPKVLYKEDDNGMMQGFDSFVDLQESLLQSQRVLDRARQLPDWKPYRKNVEEEGSVGMTDTLVVDHQKGSELIAVSATDRDLKVATAAVKCILSAYLEISNDTNGEGSAQRLSMLEDRRASFTSQLHVLHDRVLAIVNEFGSDDLSTRCQAKLEEVNRIELRLQEIAMSLSTLQAPSPTTKPDDATSQPTQTSISEPEAAAADPTMRELLTERNRLSGEVTHLQIRQGENNPELVAARTELDEVKRKIEGLLDNYRLHGLPRAGLNHLNGTESVGDLLTEQSNLRGMYARVQAEMIALGSKDVQLRDLKRDEATIRQNLNDVNDAIDHSGVEAPMANRVSIMSYGEVPTVPPKSKRKPVTAAAGVAGFGFGVGLVACWGLLDRRLRSVLQLQQMQPDTQLLGSLPTLPEKLSDPEQKAIAAHCVHQIRNLLDRSRSGKSSVLAVTSPTAGDGKTSLVLSLGVSFATAGLRTLLIDCDMVGGGLTSRLNATARRMIGAILVRDATISSAQLQDAIRHAKGAFISVPEALVRLGLATEEDIRRAAALRDEQSVGLLEALEGEDLNSCVTKVLTDNLYVLPLGDASQEHSVQMSPKTLRRVLTQARQRFDFVIVDTGPILGSLEAAIVVREVDEVVLAVAKYGRTAMLKKAISLLETLGVRLTGIVFNRASAKDVAASSYGASVGSTTIRSSSVVSRRRDGVVANGSLPSLGSLAQALVSSTVIAGETNGATKSVADAAAKVNANGGEAYGNSP